MAFEMSLPRTKRVKYIEPDGKEVFVDGDQWAFLRAVETAQLKEAEGGGDSKDGVDDEKAKPSTSVMPSQPWEALEMFMTARGEVDVVLDLIGFVEAAQHLGIANIPPRNNTLDALTAQHGLKVQSKAAQLQDAAERLRRGARALRAALEKEDAFYEGLAAVHSRWRLGPGLPGRGAPFSVLLDFPFPPAPQMQATVPLGPGAAPSPAAATSCTADVIRDPAGRVAVVLDEEAAPAIPREPREGETLRGDAVDGEVGSGPAGALPPGEQNKTETATSQAKRTTVVGVAAVNEALARRQDGELWGALRSALERELGSSRGGGAPRVLAADLVARLRAPQDPTLTSIAAALLHHFLRMQDGKARVLVAGLAGWIRHRCAAQTLRRSLETQALTLPGTRVTWMPAAGIMKSIMLVDFGGEGCAAVACQLETVGVDEWLPRRRATLPESLARNAWQVRRGDVDSLLATIARGYAPGPGP